MNGYDKIYIGVTGLAGSGKDTFCDMLMDNVGDHIIPHRIALADPLKRTVSELYGVPLNHFYDRDLKEEPIALFEENDSEYVTTPRHLLQQFGTEIVRKMDVDHWVLRFPKEVDYVIDGWYSFARYGYGHESRNLKIHYTSNVIENKKCGKDNIELIIVPDVRFENEQKMIKDYSGNIINITRDNLDVGEMDMTHASETSITKEIQPDFEISNNTDLSQLKIKAIATLNKLGLR